MSETFGTLLKYLMSILAVVAVMDVIYTVHQQSKTEGASADLVQLANKIQAMYGSQVRSSTISLSELQHAGFMPADWAASTNQW